MSFPMYDLPALRAANAALLAALEELLREEGVDPTRAPITQICGYPLQTVYRGRYTVLGIPCYGAPGCDGPAHRAFIVVSAASPITSVKDLRGSTFAVNSMQSNTGMNLARHLVAPVAEGRAFFREVVLTGSHRASMEAVARGRADAAAIDCVTLALHQEYEPASTQGLRVLAPTSGSPSIPFVTSRATCIEAVEALQRALGRFSLRADYASTRNALRIDRIEVTSDPAAYGVLLDYRAEAVALGYPSLV